MNEAAIWFMVDRINRLDYIWPIQKVQSCRIQPKSITLPLHASPIVAAKRLENERSLRIVQCLGLTRKDRHTAKSDIEASNLSSHSMTKSMLQAVFAKTREDGSCLTVGRASMNSGQ
jgi:hypothetical protein